MGEVLFYIAWNAEDIGTKITHCTSEEDVAVQRVHHAAQDFLERDAHGSEPTVSFGFFRTSEVGLFIEIANVDTAADGSRALYHVPEE